MCDLFQCAALMTAHGGSNAKQKIPLYCCTIAVDPVSSMGTATHQVECHQLRGGALLPARQDAFSHHFGFQDDGRLHNSSSLQELYGRTLLWPLRLPSRCPEPVAPINGTFARERHTEFTTAFLGFPSSPRAFPTLPLTGPLLQHGSQEVLLCLLGIS